MYLRGCFDEPKVAPGLIQRSAKAARIELGPGRWQPFESRRARARWPRCGPADFRVDAADPAVGFSSAQQLGVTMVGCRTLGQIRGHDSIHSPILHLDPETAIDHG